MAHSESDEYDLKHYTSQMKRHIIKLKAIIDLEHYSPWSSKNLII